MIAGAYTESDARAAVHRVAFALHSRFKASFEAAAAAANVGAGVRQCSQLQSEQRCWQRIVGVSRRSGCLLRG